MASIDLVKNDGQVTRPIKTISYLPAAADRATSIFYGAWGGALLLLLAKSMVSDLSLESLLSFIIVSFSVFLFIVFSEYLITKGRRTGTIFFYGEAFALSLAFVYALLRLYLYSNSIPSLKAAIVLADQGKLGIDKIADIAIITFGIIITTSRVLITEGFYLFRKHS